MIKRRENVYFLRARAFRTTHTNLGLLFFFFAVRVMECCSKYREVRKCNSYANFPHSTITS